MSMIGLIEPLYRFAAESSVGACIAVCAVLLLQRIFRSRFSPRWRYLMWTLLVARLMLPWMPESPISVAGLFSLVSHEAVVSRSAPEAAPERVAVRSGGTRAVSAAETAPVAQEKADVEVASSWPDTGSMMRLVWLVGCLVFGVHVLTTSWRVPRNLRNAKPITGLRILSIYEGCKKQMNVRGRPALLEDADLMYPVVCGIIHPRLIVPRYRLDTLSDSELRHVFLHELGHLKRCDLLMALLTAGLQAMHWFNPLVWYGFHRMRQDREFACDALALSRMTPEDADSYGHTLIKLMENRARPMRLAGAAAILEHGSQLKRRIEMITRHKSSPYRLTWIGLVLFAMCAVVLLTRASAIPSEPLPHVIPIELYQTEWSQFRTGDSITVTELRGTSPRIEVGQTYQVKGHYLLASENSAMLSLYCTNGDVRETRGPQRAIVKKGEGDFAWEFKIVKLGGLHVSYYPAKGGDGFGGCYFRQPGVDDGSENWAIEPGSLDIPAVPPEPLPNVIPIEMYEPYLWSKSRPGDSITVTELRGSSPRIEAGQIYQVKGHYVLASEDSAMIALYCTNGNVKPSHGPKQATVKKGEGDFAWEFKIAEAGMLHVGYYPAGGGDGFGGCYFRQRAASGDSPDAAIDLAVTDADFTFNTSNRHPGYSLNARIRNTGNAVSPEFKIWFYQGDPATTEPMTHGGGPIHPGETWSESSLAVQLHEGANTFYVKIDPDDAVQESDESNNVATLTVKGRKVVREVVELEQGN